MKYYNLTPVEIFERLNTNEKGLSSSQAKIRLDKVGKNLIRKEKKVPIIFRVAASFFDLMILILLVAALISYLLGSKRDAQIILGIVILNTLIGFSQEYKAEKIIEALKKIIPAKAKVKRDGQIKEILAQEVVPGDIIILEPGANVPADARIIESNNLKVNEFTITGESFASKKVSQVIDRTKLALTDIDNMVFMGTQIESGEGVGVVTATGMQTEFGQIAHYAQETKREKSPLQKELWRAGKFVLKLTLVALIIFLIITILTTRNFGQSLVFSIALSLGAVPEGLPATVSIALALAIQRMVKQKAVIKKLSAVETLGCTNVICTDKTGTLTKNEMTIQKIWLDQELITVSGIGYEPVGRFYAPDELKIKDFKKYELFFRTGVLCNNAQLLDEQGKNWRILGDSTEGSLLVLARKAGFSEKKICQKFKKIAEIPFDPARKMMTVVAKGQKEKPIAYIKGAPKVILGRSSKIWLDGEIEELTDLEKKKILEKINYLARDALRVLALAYRPNLPKIKKYESHEIENDLIFLGLVGMMDPPRPEVREAITICKTAGIKVIMITGDYGITAEAVARQIGLVKGYPRIITGTELNNMSDEELKEELTYSEIIFARASPENKLRIVSALKEMGQVVAVTGDGVNDAPALKKADIGVAMGQVGIDVAKESSEMVLMDDNFATIVNAVREGRIVYDNMKKFIFYIFSSNLGEITVVIFGILLQLPLPLMAVQILAIDLGTDVLPSLSLGVEPGEPGVMKRPPRNINEKLISRSMIGRLIFVGLIMGAGGVIAFLSALLHHGWDWGGHLVIGDPIYRQATAVTYTTLVLSQVANVFCSRSETNSLFKIGFFSNLWLIGAVAISLGMLFALTNVPFLQDSFHTASFDREFWLYAALTGIVLFIAEEIRKIIVRVRSVELRIKIAKPKPVS